jgi:hypothetical protein
MTLTFEIASMCCDLCLSISPLRALSSYFPSATTAKSRTTERHTFCLSQHRLHLRPTFHSLIYQVIISYLGVAASTFKMRPINSDEVVAEHRATREKEEVDAITYASSSSSGTLLLIRPYWRKV